MVTQTSHRFNRHRYNTDARMTLMVRDYVAVVLRLPILGNVLESARSLDQSLNIQLGHSRP